MLTISEINPGILMFRITVANNFSVRRGRNRVARNTKGLFTGNIIECGSPKEEFHINIGIFMNTINHSTFITRWRFLNRIKSKSQNQTNFFLKQEYPKSQRFVKH